MIARFFAAALALSAVFSHASAQQAAPEAARPGYLFVMGTTTNTEVLGKYARTLPAIYEKYQGYYLASGGVGRGVRVLEGEFKQQSVILAKFPDVGGPNTFWWSPEYRQSAEIRKGAGTFNVLKLKGMPGDLGKPEGRPAYLISIAEIRDREKLKPYSDVAGPLVKAAGAKFVSAGGRKDIELLEGEFGNKNVNILQFPSLEALRKFYEDPAYQKVIPIRQSAGDYVLLEVEGFQPRN
ncbi:MAG: DUF1330 domain-containing protein [Rhodospirillaceae bacterium]|nr:DUF1330 domain-containing protein [Rhodospirillaceae bacterium]